MTDSNAAKTAIDLDEVEERLALTGDLGLEPWEAKALLAELRSSRKVVEAALEYRYGIEAVAALVEPWNAPELDSGIARALAELESASTGSSGTGASWRLPGS